MEPLPLEIRSCKVKQEALKVQKEIFRKEQKPFDDLFKVTYNMTKPKIIRAVILKSIENVVILILSLILKTFVPEVKKAEEERRKLIIILCPILASLLGFIRYILKEHSSKFINQSCSMVGQTLRAMLFHKLRNTNLSFLRNADESIITKTFLFDLDILLGYFGKLPDLFSFPIIFILSNAIMIYFISFTSMFSFVSFIFAWSILIYVTKKLAKKNLKYEYYGSKRSFVVSEIINKMETIKMNSAELYFERRVNLLRNKEEQCIKEVNHLKAIAGFIMSLAPLFSILGILLLEQQVRGTDIDLTTTFTIVSIIASLNKPLKRFVDILDRYYEYKHAKMSLNQLLYLIPDKPNDAQNVDTLVTGTIIVTDCSTEIEDEAFMRQELRKIFGEALDFDHEDIKFGNLQNELTEKTLHSS